jgi:hypothetical protein
MSAREAFFSWREDSARRPYLYNAARPVFSFVTALLIYLGGMFALTSAIAACMDDPAPVSGLFVMPYWGPLAMWIGACSWWGERRQWQRYVVKKATDVMIGPVEEFGEQA